MFSKAFKSCFKTQIARIHRDAKALYLMHQHNDLNRLNQFLILLLLAYLLSPIDLIPDFIPVLGFLDELLIIPSLIYLMSLTISAEQWQSYRQQAETTVLSLSPPKYTRLIIISTWLLWMILVIMAVLFF